MTLKRTGPATDWREVDRWDHGVGWIAHPDERIERASHAIEVDGEVWVVEPVDAPGIDDLLAEFGDVAGVVVLLDRHTRDADAVAERHGVSVHAPYWVSGLDRTLDAPVERVRRELDDTGYGLHQTVDLPFWREGMLYGEDTGVLVVADALGTAEYFVTGEERVGVHPLLRPVPPKALDRLSPDRILVGHGEGVHDDAATALAESLEGTRSRMPRLYADALRRFIPV